MKPKVYLIPTVLHEDETAMTALPAYIKNAVADCQVFFTENERTARRFLKKLWKEIVIDDYAWYAIHKAEATVIQSFLQHLDEGKNIGILSEAGCPCVADPGSLLVAAAQEKGVKVIPLVGPNSILLALMASGMNGQCFQFAGYLPVEAAARKKALKELEDYSMKKNCTQVFIETPYRNNQLLQDIISVCRGETRLCIAVGITAASESIVTKKLVQWKQSIPDLHKRPCIFLLAATP